MIFSPKRVKVGIEIRRLLIIWVIGLITCMSAWTGRVHSIDEHSIMATASSLARYRHTDTNLLAYTHYDLPPPGGLGRFGESPFGSFNYYSKKGPAPAFLAAPLYWLGLRLPWLSPQHAAFTLNTILTATTCALIYTTLRRLRTSPLCAFIGAVPLYLWSPMLLYSGMLFGEPAAALGMAMLMYAVAAPSSAKKGITWGLGGAGIALAMATNLVYVTFAPIAALFVMFARKNDKIKRLIAFAISLAIMGMLLAAWNFVRFGTLLQSGYHFDSGEGFTTPVWFGAYGLLLSPGAGLIWFFPVSVYAVGGWLFLRRQRSSLAWLGLAVLLWHLIAFGSWWAWAGGVSWGPRFLVPVLPFIIVMAVPTIKRLFSTQRFRRMLLTVGMLPLIFSFVTGAASLFVDFSEIHTVIARQEPPQESRPPGFSRGWHALTEPAFSPVLVAFSHLSEAEIIGGAGVTAKLSMWVGGPLLGLFLMVKKRRLTPILLAGLLILAVAYVGAQPDTLTGLWGKPLNVLPGALTRLPPKTAIFNLAPELTWPLFHMGRYPPVYGLPRNAWDEDAERLFQSALAGADRAILIYFAWGEPNGLDARLAEWGALDTDVQLDDYRVMTFVRER